VLSPAYVRTTTSGREWRAPENRLLKKNRQVSPSHVWTNG
jgi:hypothetical protein